MRKNRPVLYELVQQGKRQRQPTWRERAGNGGSAGASAAGEETTAPPPPPVEKPTPAEPTFTRRTDRPAAERLYDFEDGVLTLRLNWVSGTVLIIGMFVFMLVSYQIGTQAGASATGAPAAGGSGAGLFDDGEEPETVLKPEDGNTDPVPSVEHRPSGSGPVALPGRRVEETTRTPNDATAGDAMFDPPLADGFYILVQHIPKNYEQPRAVARAAVRFLEQQGIPAAIQEMRREFQVIATRTFPSKSAANSLLNQVRRLGKQEFVSGTGTYDLARAYIIERNAEN